MYYSLTRLSMMTIERIDEAITAQAGKLWELKRERRLREESKRIKAIIDCNKCLHNGRTLCDEHSI